MAIDNKDKKGLKSSIEREQNELACSAEREKIKGSKNLNVPPLRFPEFNGEWEKYKLSKICSFFSGGTPSSSKKEYYDGNIPFIRSGELHEEQTELFITEDGFKNSATKMVEVGDLLLALYGATSGDIAISKINGAINQAILCIRTNQNKKFIESIWRKHVEKLLQTYLQGGQGNLSADIVKNISFYFSRIEEQNKLAEFISLLDERIATQNKIIEKYESLIKGLNDSLYKQYGNAITTSFADLGHSYSGLSGKSAEDFGSGKPFITYLNVYSNSVVNENDYQYVRISDGEKQNVVKYGDVLFTLSSETPEEVGIGSIYLGKSDVYLNSFCFGIHITDTKVAFPPYLSYYVSSTPFRKFIYPYAQGSTRFNLCKADFEKARIKIPSLENQKRIYFILSHIASKVKTETKLLDLFRLQKQSLLRQMFI
ncbi:restriction endonuclease subunit S [Bacteroides sp. f07]|uniref:restriction endonuclease subunit S n=1 Tax=Bacteroides sp. f07 TaxID=3132704 RepID=UPI0036F1FE3E